MDFIKEKIPITSKKKSIEISALHMRFSPYRLFQDLKSDDAKRCLKLIGEYLCTEPRVALYGETEFSENLLKNSPKLSKHILGSFEKAEDIPNDVKSVFLCATKSWVLSRMEKNLPETINVITPEIIKSIGWQSIPAQAWVPEIKSIYPIDIPDIEFLPNQDLIVVDSPARNLAFLPNGLAYVHNALKKTSLKFQTIDLDVIIYHRYHTHRLLDRPDNILTPSGKEMHYDPWLAEAYMEWTNLDVVEYFRPAINEVIDKLIKANPKIIGFSLQGCNIIFVREVVTGVKKALPEAIILVGGFSCYQPTIGRNVFPESDYMCIGEADLTIGPLVEALAKGERPKDIPGVLSRYDTPGYIFTNYPMPLDLDSIEMAKYDWTDIKLYRNYNDYQLTPIIASRGCRWSRCTFCAERFYWRIRDTKLVVDEFEYLHDNGCDLFMFNESDLNGLPERLVEICDEIVKRGLKLKLTGQLRIHKKATREYYDKLRAGGFVALRFGVDAWSKNTLRLQMKGYTLDMIYQNLKDCHESGIYTEVNTVIGIPGETEADIDESIELMLKCNPFIGRHANMNTLILAIGSVYWEDPDRFKIKFRDHTKEEIFKKFPSYVPADYWYSEEPYIDQDIRTERYKKVIKTLHENKVDMGPFLKGTIERITEKIGDEYGEKETKTNKNRDDFAIKIKKEISNEIQLGQADPYKIVFHNNKFWGVDPVELEIELSHIKYISYLNKLNKAFKKGLPHITDYSKLKRHTNSALRILSEDGPIVLVKKFNNKIRNFAKSID